MNDQEKLQTTIDFNIQVSPEKVAETLLRYMQISDKNSEPISMDIKEWRNFISFIIDKIFKMTKESLNNDIFLNMVLEHLHVESEEKIDPQEFTLIHMPSPSSYVN